ncbi:hypothetical protein KJ966_05200 [bacterium]|nr:hypothetical protein [bacterium]
MKTGNRITALSESTGFKKPSGRVCHSSSKRTLSKNPFSSIVRVNGIIIGIIIIISLIIIG